MHQLELPAVPTIPWWKRPAFILWAKRVGTVLAGAILGWSCPYWPPALHPVCTIAAKALSLLRVGP